MKILLYTFSGTGNTWWLAQTFQKLAQEQNIQVTIRSIEKIRNYEENLFINDVKSADILGMAFPIYGSTWPNIVKEFTLHLLNIWDKRQSEIDPLRPSVLILTTMMLFSGDGAIVPRQHFVKKGFPFKWAINIPITSNISIPIFRANPYKLPKIEKNKKKAIPKLQKLLHKISTDKSWLEHRWNLPFRFLGKIQRIFEPLLYKMVQFSVDDGRCTQCEQCVQYCPMDNISFDQASNSIHIGEDCTFCMRCYNLCPTYAIKAGKKVSPPPKYKRLHLISEDFTYKDIHE